MRVLAIIITLSFISSCNEKLEVTPGDRGENFYPISIGQYRIYDVEEIIYNISSFDTSLYQLRETIFDSIVSPDQTTYLIRRDKRDMAQDEWESDSVWTVSRTENFLSVSENNIPFMKLTFPVTTGRQWDGNSLNSLSELTYYYTSLAAPLIDSIAVEDHIRVIIEDIEPNVVNQDERSEVYVKGVGLVQKDYLSLNFCTVDCNEIGEIQSGRFLNQVLIEAGNE